MTADRATNRDPDIELVPPRRNLLSRLSFGHVLMILAGLLALLLNVALLRSQDDRVEVLVAGESIPAGSRLVAANIGFTSVAADSPFIGRVLTRESVQPLLGQIVTRDIEAGAPLLADDLRPSAAPDAGRAMSIPISPSQAVAADLRRGDRVDVISVVDGAPTYIASDIEVLAVGEPGQGRLATTSDYSVTVGVDADVALAIAGALDAGEVHIVRSTGADAVGSADVGSGG